MVSDLNKAGHSLSPGSPERDMLEQLAGITFISWDFSLLNEQLAIMTSQFYITAAIWLNMKIGATQPTNQIEVYSCLSHCIPNPVLVARLCRMFLSC